jgi:cytosine/adenosine deaminase-related metal-dependent hydrolase
MAERRILVAADNAAIGVADGVIVEPSGRFDLELRLPGRTIRPGLINAHEHLHRNHYGRLGAPPYPDAYAWARDVERRYRDRIEVGRRVPRREALLTGAWKNLFAGVTTVVHHDRWEADFEEDFPLRVVPLDWADSLGMTPALDGIHPGRPFCLHLAEGTSEAAAREVHELEARGLLDANLIAVHGVGMDAAAIALFRSSGAALVWCPTSNLFLLGRTAPAELLADGADVLLGSDSLLSAEGDLLDELRAARKLGFLNDHRLESAVGEVAARRMGIAVPSLEPGARADFVVLAKPLLEASAQDVELVVAGGVPRVATPWLGARLHELGLRGRSMTVGGVTRWVNGGGTQKHHGDEPKSHSRATTAGVRRAEEG